MSTENCECYTPDVAWAVRVVYGLLSGLWIILIWWLQLHRMRNSWVLLTPLVVFGIGAWNATVLDTIIEKDMFTANFLGMGLVILLPLLTWCHQDYAGDRDRFTRGVIAAMVVSLFSLLDVWVPRHWFSVYRHFKSALQTISVCIVVLIFLDYFTMRPLGRAIGAK